ncbi:unnamed protein product, partial [Effrenium voratum]
APLRPIPEPAADISVVEMDEEVTRHLEAFFSDEDVWQKLKQDVLGDVSSELTQKIHHLPVVANASKFKVTVPKPYPGVQYRRSKHLEERYSRYAENGAIVVGQLMDGEWLCISGNIFLPVQVGQIHILEEVMDAEESSQLDPKATSAPKEAWWVCCPSSASQKVAEAAAGGVALEQVAQPMRPGPTSN